MSIKFVAGLLIGAAAGAAIVHFLNTEEGKAFTRKLKKDAAEVEKELASMAKSFMNDVGDKVDEATA